MNTPLESDVARHYSRAGLLTDIERALAEHRTSGTPERPAELAPVDEFHTAGRAATLKALEHFPVRPDMHVLDAGAGLGGTARVLAAERGCSVTGLDLTPDYVATACALTARLGLTGRCRFTLGSVTRMPFAAASFDAALSFHVAMNVADREAFYAELARVLRPGAPLCLYDVMKGPAPGMRFPVPWAETASTSVLRSRDDTVRLATAAGFELVREDNLREFAIAFFREAAKQTSGRATTEETAAQGPVLGLHLLAGHNSALKFTNYLQSLEEHQIEPVILHLRRV